MPWRAGRTSAHTYHGRCGVSRAWRRAPSRVLGRGGHRLHAPIGPTREPSHYRHTRSDAALAKRARMTLTTLRWCREAAKQREAREYLRVCGNGACSQPGSCSRLANCEARRRRDAARWYGDPCATTNACFESGRVPTRPIGRSRSRSAPQLPLRAYAKACEWHVVKLPSGRHRPTSSRPSLVSHGDKSPPAHHPSMGSELTTTSAERARVVRLLPRAPRQRALNQAPARAQMRLCRCACADAQASLAMEAAPGTPRHGRTRKARSFRLCTALRWALSRPASLNARVSADALAQNRTLGDGGRSWYVTTRPHAEGDKPSAGDPAFDRTNADYNQRKTSSCAALPLPRQSKPKRLR